MTAKVIPLPERVTLSAQLRGSARAMRISHVRAAVRRVDDAIAARTRHDSAPTLVRLEHSALLHMLDAVKALLATDGEDT